MSEPAVTPARRHRLEVRITPEQDALIRQAADLEDTTVTAFVLDTVTVPTPRLVRKVAKGFVVGSAGVTAPTLCSRCFEQAMVRPKR